jgi:Arc/MetJ-type ribon-helix-helix transcriptional regulator
MSKQRRAHKERLTVTVDPELVRAANAAVSAGRVASLSGWVNLALSERATKDARLQAMTEAIAAYETEFGEISADEIKKQSRADKVSARHPKSRSA